jgi:Uma2 family endonuclease
MSATAQPLMTVETFLAWAMEQPEGSRYELRAGRIVSMAPQRSGHALMAFRAARRLAEAVERASLDCTVYGDGITVRVDDATTYIPDAMVRCGPDLPGDALAVTDPMVLIEVVSPSSASRDQRSKLIDYFRIPSLRHYLIIDGDSRTVIHHARNDDGTILTRIVRDGGAIALDPPGLLLDGLFAA